MLNYQRVKDGMGTNHQKGGSICCTKNIQKSKMRYDGDSTIKEIGS